MKNLKKGLSVLLSLVLVLGSFGVLSAYAEATAIWDEESGALTITGSGSVTADIISGTVPDKTKIKEVVLTDGITSVGDGVFRDCTNLESIALCPSVEEIGRRAFYGCLNLSSIDFPNNLVSIGDNAFNGCRSLMSVTLSQVTESIGERAFYGCSGLKSVAMTGVTAIGSHAFYGCSSLSSVTIPHTIEFCTSPDNYQMHSYLIGDNAFGGCTNLATAFVPYIYDADYSYEYRRLFPATTMMLVYRISGSGATITQAIGNTAAESVVIPDHILSFTVIDISQNVFKSYYNMIAAVVPEAAHTKDAFPSFTLLISDRETPYGNADAPVVTIPEYITSIPEGTFAGFENLRSIEVESGHNTFIGYDCILYRKDSEGRPINLICYPQQKADLKEFRIPDGVTAISGFAFYGCSALKKITIPASVTSIGARAFENCTGLERIEVDEANDNFICVDGVIYTKGGSGSPETLVYYPPNKPDESFVIPSGVTAINDFAFKDCVNLKNVEIPSGVESIGAGAFAGCTGITQITVPESVGDIGQYAFDGIINVTYYRDGGPSCGARYVNCYLRDGFVFSDPEMETLVGCFKETERLRIPDSVVAIGESAFEYCDWLCKLTVPGSLRIGTNAFRGCYNLKNVFVPTYCSLTYGDSGWGPTIDDPGSIIGSEPDPYNIPRGTFFNAPFIWRYTELSEWDFPYEELPYDRYDGLTHTLIQSIDLSQETVISVDDDYSVIRCDDMGEGLRIEMVSVSGVTLKHCADCPDFVPEYISCYEDLKAFALRVNSGETDLCAVLTCNIDASASAQQRDWIPIGNNSRQYTGSFDGDNYTIYGLTYNNSANGYAGLFGAVGPDGVVQNVGLEDGEITGTDYTGGVAGYNAGTIIYCHSTGFVSGSGDYAGGVAGYNAGVTGYCYNTGKVKGANQYTGGVAGYNEDTITSCYNTGEVEGRGKYTGGVVGYNEGQSSIFSIINCYNTGTVSGFSETGGVVGYNEEGKITNCCNKGDVYGSCNTGGVVGFNESNSSVSVCYNTGAVTVTITDDYINSISRLPEYYTNAGGVAGYNEEGKITNCYNTGAVTLTVIVDPYLADIDDNAGGVAGYNKGGSVTGCYNTGAVSCNENAGGVIGLNESERPVANCYNTGAVTGYNYAGGVAGRNDGSLITNCYNTGAVSGESAAGGTAGYNGGSITDCYNMGDVSGLHYAGGVAGWNSIGSIKNCYYIGAVYGEEMTGNVVGWNWGSSVTNCYYDKSLCEEIGAVNFTDFEEDNVKGLTTAQMTGIAALENMVFSYEEGETSPWLAKANTQGISFYPHLRGFNLNEYGEQLSAENIQAKDWPAKAGAAVSESVPEICAHSLTLGGDIGVNFYVKIEDVSGNAYAEFTVDGKTVNVPIDLSKYKVLDDGTAAYKFTCNVAAAQIGERITGRIYAGGNWAEVEYSVYDYLTELSEDQAYMQSEDLEGLARAIAVYGYYANELFGYYELAPHALFDSSGIQAVTAQSLAQSAPVISNTEGDIKYVGSTLVLRTKTAIRHYFTLPKGKTVGDYTFVLGEGENAEYLTPVLKGRYYYIEISDIPSAELGDETTVTVLNGEDVAVSTWRYSALSYAYLVLGSYENGDESVSAELADAVKALVLYNYAAVAYFGTHITE